MVQFQLGHTINQEELDKLSFIKPVSILFDNLIVKNKTHEQVISSSVYNAKIRSKLYEYIGGTNTSIAFKFGQILKQQNVGSSINLYTRFRPYF